MITHYNGEASYHVKNLAKIVSKQLKLSGFIVTTLWKKHLEDFYSEIPPKVARGEIKYLEDITHGLDKAGEAILAVQIGKNHGKSVVLVAEE